MNTKDSAYKDILKLVERFEEQFQSYKSVAYNEANTRKDFIDPFFTALGWDMNNSQGYAEAYREVIHEDKLKVSGGVKAPDYSFKLPGGKRLFFVEAKKPHVVVKDEILPAYQVRRYGWSAVVICFYCLLLCKLLMMIQTIKQRQQNVPCRLMLHLFADASASPPSSLEAEHLYFDIGQS